MPLERQTFRDYKCIIISKIPRPSKTITTIICNERDVFLHFPVVLRNLTKYTLFVDFDPGASDLPSITALSVDFYITKLCTELYVTNSNMILKSSAFLFNSSFDVHPVLPPFPQTVCNTIN
jgi:hypothetical protein